MPSQRAAQLEQAIETYQVLFANYTNVRERLIARRRGAADHVMVELDDRLAANQRTIDAIGRAVEMTRGHLKLEEQPAGLGVAGKDDPARGD